MNAKAARTYWGILRSSEVRGIHPATGANSYGRFELVPRAAQRVPEKIVRYPANYLVRHGPKSGSITVRRFET